MLLVGKILSIANTTADSQKVCCYQGGSGKKLATMKLTCKTAIAKPNSVSIFIP
jgi:hypothetical protein